MQAFTRVLLTGFVVLLAVGVLLFKYWQYVTNPWTRNGLHALSRRAWSKLKPPSPTPKIM
jgi:hypothetical protein